MFAPLRQTLKTLARVMLLIMADIGLASRFYARDYFFLPARTRLRVPWVTL
jgi:hypothetical protein